MPYAHPPNVPAGYVGPPRVAYPHGVGFVAAGDGELPTRMLA